MFNSFSSEWSHSGISPDSKVRTTLCQKKQKTKKQKTKKTASLPSTWLKKLSFQWSQLMICRQTPKTEQHKTWKGPSQNPSYINHLVSLYFRLNFQLKFQAKLVLMLADKHVQLSWRKSDRLVLGLCQNSIQTVESPGPQVQEKK